MLDRSGQGLQAGGYIRHGNKLPHRPFASRQRTEGGLRSVMNWLLIRG